VKIREPGTKSPAFIKLMRKENVEYMLDLFKSKKKIELTFVLYFLIS